MLSVTSQTVLSIIADQLEKGDIKGRKEYGVTIDEASDVQYNWQLEAMAEMADALKYQQKEIAFLRKQLAEMKRKTWFPVYQENLELKQDNEKLKKIVLAFEKSVTGMIERVSEEARRKA